MNKVKNMGGALLAISLAFGGLAFAGPANANEEVVPTNQEVPTTQEVQTQEVVSSPTTEVPVESTPLPEAAEVPVLPVAPLIEVKAEVLTYHAAIWEAALNLQPKFPQTLVHDGLTTSADVHQFDSFATKCNTTYQFDLYADDAATIELITTGVLQGNEESWVGGSYKSEYSNVFTTAPCAPPVVQPCTAFGTTTYTATDENGTLPATIDTSDTRTSGHNQIVSNELHVWTTDATSQGKAAGYFATPGLTLGTVGTPALQLSASTGVAPGFQIVLSTGRILVGEPGYYGNRFWSKTAQAGVPANDGYLASADLNTWFAAMGDIAIPYEGYSVGSGVLGDSTITKITNGTGCDIVFADYVKPVVVPEQPKPTVTTREVSSDVQDCAAKTVTTTTEHYSTTTTYVYDSESNDYNPVVGAEVRGEDTTSVREATAVECPVTVVVDTPKVVTSKVLAFTGSDPTVLLVGGGVGLFLGLALIVSLWAYRRRVTRDSSELELL